MSVRQAFRWRREAQKAAAAEAPFAFVTLAPAEKVPRSPPSALVNAGCTAAEFHPTRADPSSLPVSSRWTIEMPLMSLGAASPRSSNIVGTTSNALHHRR